MRTQYKHTPTLMLFSPPDCLAISRWFHHLNIGLIIGNFLLVSSLEYRFNHLSYRIIFKKMLLLYKFQCCEDLLTSTSQFVCLGKLASLNEEHPPPIKIVGCLARNKDKFLHEKSRQLSNQP